MAKKVIYCIVPRELAGKLHDPLREHFRDDPGIEVIVERRVRARRSPEDRRTEAAPGESEERPGAERRRIRNPGGRRVGDRRAPLVPVEAARGLPRRFRHHADQISFFERVEPSGEHDEDLEAARIVTRVQSGDTAAFSDLYMRYFDRVYGYLRVLLRDRHEAEDVAQQAFVQLYESISGYERRRQPFRAYLFIVVRNLALSHLRKSGRLEVHDPATLDRRREQSEDAGVMELSALDWITDRDLLLFVERLPLPQRQVLLMRFMLDLTPTEIAGVLGRDPAEVRKLQFRALSFLRKRLASVGHHGRSRDHRLGWRRRVSQVRVLRDRRYALIRR